jgi:hypothetical protein
MARSGRKCDSTYKNKANEATPTVCFSLVLPPCFIPFKGLFLNHTLCAIINAYRLAQWLHQTLSARILGVSVGMLLAVKHHPNSACDQSSPHFGSAMRLEQINHALKASLHIGTYNYHRPRPWSWIRHAATGSCTNVLSFNACINHAL